jgi:hypothetical protein
MLSCGLRGFGRGLFKATFSLGLAEMARNSWNWKKRLLKDPLGLVGTLLAIAALTIGVLQSRATQDRQEQSQAVDLLIKYNELMRQSERDLTKEQLQWKDNLAVALAEAIFLLRSQDDGWVKTVRSMLLEHPRFFEPPKNGEESFLECETYARAFQALINDVAKRKVCP